MRGETNERQSGEEREYEGREYEGHVTFASGYVTRYLEDYAHGINVASSDFADRVVSLIRTAQGREVRGADNHVSPLRRNGTENNQAVEPLEVHGLPHSETQVRKPRRVDLPVRCKICNRLFPTRSKFMSHKLRKHSPGKTGAEVHRKNVSKGAVGYWSQFTPEQRSAEMRRRQDVSRKKKLEEVRRKAA
jgi:hypothetical protein